MAVLAVYSTCEELLAMAVSAVDIKWVATSYGCVGAELRAQVGTFLGGSQYYPTHWGLGLGKGIPCRYAFPMETH